MNKKALILLNMGGASNNDEIKMFLTNMFNDKNILSIPNPFRKIISYLITKNRLPHAIENYKKIGGKSPILQHTQNLVSKLQKKLNNVQIEYIMRYTPPRAMDVLSRLKSQGIEEIILLPLYPQYSTTTTKSSIEEIEETLKKIKYTPLIKKIERFYDNSAFCESIVNKILQTLGNNNPKKFDLIFSAHSLPQKIIDKGDPYESEIEDNVAILKNLLIKKGLVFNKIHIAYQSKLGPVKWLEPSLEKTLLDITDTGDKDKKNVVIYPLSFTMDNSETDFELSIEYNELAKENGYDIYRVCKCPNDSKAFVDIICQLYSKLLD